MFTRESLRKKGQDVMHDIMSSKCGHGLPRVHCDKCSAANSRYGQFVAKRKTVVSKEKRAVASVMAGTADMQLQQPCHTNPVGLVDTTLQLPKPNNITGLPQLEQLCLASNAGLMYDLSSADFKLQHLPSESTTGCDDASSNGSFLGCSMDLPITYSQSGNASSEDGNSQVGEPCTQPVLKATTLRAALSAVPVGPRWKLSTEQRGSPVPFAQSSPALSAGRRETWQAAAQEIGTLLDTTMQQIKPRRVHQLCGDASQAKDLSEAVGSQEGWKQPLHGPMFVLAGHDFISSSKAWRPMSHFMPERPPPQMRDPMYVRAPRLEVTSPPSSCTFGDGALVSMTTT